jgi:Tfp pilus assembly protein PilF
MADAAKPLNEWLSKHPDDARVRLALAQAYQERGEFKQAAAEYERVLKSHPNHAPTLNNLAWMYYEMRDSRTIETAERAHTLQPDDGAIADTFGWLLVEEGQAQRGVELLRRAAKQAPNVPDIRYHLAVALAKTGANEEARIVLAELVNSGQSFKDMAKAKQLLHQL